MAKIEPIIKIIFGWEGGWADDPTDMGGKTMMGVTLETWKSCGYDKDLDGDIDAADLKLITKKDVVDKILKPHYWDRWRADFINNQSIANICVDWVWGSGKWGITKVQEVLKVNPDGLVGSNGATMKALNGYVTQEQLFNLIKQARVTFVNNLVDNSIATYKKTHPQATQKELTANTQLKFKQGWLNRINSFSFSA